MVRQVVTHVLCDLCITDGKEVDAQETPPISVGNRKPRLLALCPEHWELWEVFDGVLLEHGLMADEVSHNRPRANRQTATRQQGRPGLYGPYIRAEDGRYVCPICPTTFGHRQGCKEHLDAHAAELGEDEVKRAMAEYDVENPATLFDNPEEDKPSTAMGPERAECEECGKVYERPKNNRPAQALGMHKKRVHGIDGKSK